VSKKPSFSVGVPTYNQGCTIRETLLSLLNQEVAPDQILVSNNHCTDNTAEVLKEFEPRVEVINPPEHLTSVGNCNYVAEHLDGDWVSVLSSDDVAYPNFVRVLREGIERSSRAVLVRAGWNTINDQGQILQRRRLLSVPAVASAPGNLMENRLGPKTGFAAFAVKRSVWREVGCFPREFAWLGDWACWVRLAPRGDFVYQDEIISGYRVKGKPTDRGNRDLVELSEVVILYRDIMPQAAAQCGQRNTHWIKKAASERLLKTLADLSNNVPRDARQPYYEALAEWAELAGETKRLQLFLDGGNVRHIDLKGNLRGLLRPALDRLKP
jgi:glycosyltransferase involved in cell wall biosynthesis